MLHYIPVNASWSAQVEQTGNYTVVGHGPSLLLHQTLKTGSTFHSRGPLSANPFVVRADRSEDGGPREWKAHSLVVWKNHPRQGLNERCTCH